LPASGAEAAAGACRTIDGCKMIDVLHKLRIGLKVRHTKAHKGRDQGWPKIANLKSRDTRQFIGLIGWRLGDTCDQVVVVLLGDWPVRLRGGRQYLLR
jgi:hypothetical protein